MAKPLVFKQRAFCALFLGLSCTGLIRAELLFPVPVNLSKGEVHLRVIVLSAPVGEAAQWVLDDDGRPGTLEQRLILEAEKQRALLVTKVSVAGKPGALKKEAPETIKVISQTKAAQFWDWEDSARQQRARVPGLADLLEDLKEYRVGSELEADVQMIPENPGATVEVKFSHTFKPEERPTTNWPLGRGLRAPRVIFSPWSIETKCHLSIGQPVLLGMQMEPPHEGEVNTGQVWFALAQLDVSPDLLPAQAPDQPAKTPVPQEANTLAWVFSVPNKLAAAWLAGRKDSTGDATTLREWLSTTKTSEGPVLAALMQIRQESRNHSKVTGRRFWEDGAGFEPGGDGANYHPLAIEEREYELRHEMESWVGIAPVGAVPDPFAPPDANAAPDTPPLIGIHTTLTLPPHPARWKLVKSAMEKTAENDPAAMELAALGEEQMTFDSSMAHGEVVAAATWPHGDRTRVAFLRVQRSQALIPVETRPIEKEPAQANHQMLWIVTTDAAPWLPKILSTSAMDDAGLAREVLAGISNGKTSLAGLLLGESSRGVSKQGTGTVENYLNTHPHLGGLPYNPRDFRRSEPGWEWQIDAQPDAGGAKLQMTLSGPTTPVTQRRWGVRLAQDTQHTPADSGIDLPVQSTQSMVAKRFVPWNQPVVLAVSQYQQGGIARLRWTIAQVTPAGKTKPALPPQTPPVGGPDPFTGNWMQAALVSMKSADAATYTPEGLKSGKLEKQLIQGVINGKMRLLDLTAITAEPGTVTRIMAAANTTFPEPRDTKMEWTHPTIPRNPPPGTPYSDQIYLQQHVGGFEIEVENWQFKLVHDGAFDIVTDTLPGYYESPRVETKPFLGAPVSVSVQRPVFTSHRTEISWPLKDRSLILPWTGAKPPDGETWVILLRALPSLRGW